MQSAADVGVVASRQCAAATVAANQAVPSKLSVLQTSGTCAALTSAFDAACARCSNALMLHAFPTIPIVCDVCMACVWRGEGRSNNGLLAHDVNVPP